MRFLFLACSVVLIPVCLQQETSPIEIHQVALSAEAPLTPVKYRTSPLNRKQRNALALKLGNSLGLKQTALNLILGKIYQAVAVGTAKAFQSGRGRRPPPPPAVSTTTEEVPEFDRAAVRLDIPGELVQIGYRLTSNISKLIGSVILNAADRKQQLVEAAKPYIAAKLGLDIRPSSFTTQPPIQDLVPRLGPPLGGPAQNSSDTTSSTSPGGASTNTSTPPSEDISANRIDRPGPGGF